MKAVLDALLVVLLGGLVIAVSYAGNRQGWAHMRFVYWAGQGLVVLPVIARMLSPRTSVGERMTLLVVVAAVQSLLAWGYSPDQLRFPDELQHYRTAADILRTHELFTANPYLAVSPAFAGMEVVTAALVDLTGLSIFHAGVVTVSVAHVLLPACVLLFAQEVTGSPRTAGIAALAYAAAPHYAYFNTLFIYSVVALPFMVLTARAAVQHYRLGLRTVWVIVAFVPVLLSHHVTAVVTTVLLVLLALMVALSPHGRRPGLTLLAVAALAAAAVVGWMAAVSPATFDYLASPLKDAAYGLLQHGKGSGPAALPRAAPRWESAVAALSMLALVATAGAGVLLLLRSRAPRFLRLFAVAGLVLPVTLAARFLVYDGPELATRGLTYAMLIASVPVAVALSWLTPRGAPRWRTVLATAMLALVAAGAVLTGLPPFWERLPGGFHVAAFESGVDRQVSAMGTWATRYREPNERAACDFSGCSQVGGYAGARISAAASPMYYAPTIAGVDRELQRLTSDYVIVDRRWARQTPITGQYFFRDVRAGRRFRPFDPFLFTKFDRDPLIDRVYDTGAIQVYDTKRVWGG